MRKTIALLCILAMLFSLTAPVFAQTRATKTYYLPVFETSDLHGYLLDTAFDTEEEYQYRLAYIADKVDDARGGNAAKTVLLDGGDIYQGNVVSNLQNGAPMVAAFDAMEYDAVALGNHEFDWDVSTTTDTDGTMPHYTYQGRSYDSKIPVLCSNIYYVSSGKRVNFTQDYVILDKLAQASDGSTLSVKVAVIGYADDYSSSIMAAEIAPYIIKTDVSAVETLASSLKSSGQADAVIVLSHAGADSISEEFSASSAVDLVCGGHTHSPLSGSGYIQAAAQGTSYATASLCFNASKNVSVTSETTHSVTSEASSLTDTAANSKELAADVLSISHTAVDDVRDQLTTKLGYITTSVTKTAIGGNSMSSTAGNWMTDLANRATGSQVSITNNGGIRTSLYVDDDRRDVTMGDVYTIAPFCNCLYVYDVTYTKLLSLLNWCIGSGRGLSPRMSGIDCYYSGSSVSALVLNGVCIYKDGKWRTGQANQTVRISTNEFIATSDTPFLSMNSGSEFVTNAMVDNESFIAVLQKEGVDGTGHLYVDENAHLISGSYSGSLDTENTCNHVWNAGIVTTSPTCTKTGVKTYACTLCGTTKTEVIAALGHSPVTDAAVLPTCTQTGLSAGSHCSRCGITLVAQTLVPANGHSPVTVAAVAPTCTQTGLSAGSHCSVCGAVLTAQSVLPMAEHTWDEGVITTPATETSDGEKIYTCIVCGATKTAVIPSPLHVHSYTDTVTAPTCTEQGYTTHTCKCGASYVDTYVAATGHTSVATAETAATCVLAGSHGGTHCSVCGAVLTDPTVLPALGHIDVNGDGLCDRCGIKFTALQIENPFVDLKQDGYYYKAVLWALTNQITSGIDNTHFAPDAACTRAQVVTFLWRSMGGHTAENSKMPFTDVKETAYYYKALSWAVENGITDGVDATHFAPDATVTRGQFVTFLWRAMGEQKPEKTGTDFADVNEKAFYYTAVVWAVEYAVTNGVDSTHFMPDQACTRGQVVTFLWRGLA